MAHKATPSIRVLEALPEKPISHVVSQDTQRIRIAITIESVNSVLEHQFHVSNQDHLVILVHGIFTRAHWMDVVKPALEHAGFSVGSTSYGEYAVSRFLLPVDWPRRKAIERVVRGIRTARSRYKRERGVAPFRMSVISHSFGTYVIGRILDDIPDLEWYRIIFCGSVVQEDYRFDKVETQFIPPLLNEVGTKDFWPALGESAGWGYGSIGSHGLNDPLVETRWHTGFKHSDFLKKEFCENFWIPFLRGEKLIQRAQPTRLPWWISGLARLPLRWGLLPFLLCWRLFLFLLPIIILSVALWMIVLIAIWVWQHL